MKVAIRAVAALGLVALAGCSSAPPDTGFVAKAPDEPIPPPEPITLTPRQKLEASITRKAIAYDIPESLIHRAVRRESNYNPAAKNGPYWGLMQISYPTARSVGYNGPAKGLLDAETNLNYGVAYLANAYRVAEGDISRAIRLYSTGFYYEAKRKGLLGVMRGADSTPEKVAAAETSAAPSAK
ncbi:MULTISPECIES: lytic transglycosylase domain-containing protein [Methylosinus]|uniref:Lytic transglycosylase n=1 Tax=Methylosinus trichosporium (strain ATCC 35070 / NCIMB 11131 / UNIQEM 75 / OB3b) TaxID=595536 RepID=A0A2D2D3F5_METT3|nr:lytic transglycosylase [Methylosinus trichosporium OB3b]